MSVQVSKIATGTLTALLEESNAQVVAKVNGRDVTRGELSAAFDLVADPSNWKMPIDKTVDLFPAQVPMIHEAVLFFAGCHANFAWDKMLTDGTGRHRFRVTAAGYYNAVGA